MTAPSGTYPTPMRGRKTYCAECETWKLCRRYPSKERPDTDETYPVCDPCAVREGLRANADSGASS